MTRALALTENQIAVICRGAAKAGHVAEVKIGEVVVRLIPKGDAQESSKVDGPVTADSFDTLGEYLAWRDRSGAGGA